MRRRLTPSMVAASLLTLSACGEGGSAPASPTEITTFAFETVASRNPAFDPSSFRYPANHARAGEVNSDAGDVRLDAVIVDGVTYPRSRMQLVSSARIVLDDAVDPARGGGNLAVGYGIGADVDPWVGQGPGTTTPTPEDLRDGHANFNLTSLVAVRENIGTTIYELSFDRPTDTVLIWERGNSGDVLVEAMDDAENVRGSFLLLDGVNDGDQAGHYAPTGVSVTTYVLADFLNQGQEHYSVGLRLSEPVRTFRFTSYHEEEGEGARRFNGPDLKVIGLDAEGS